LFLPETESVGGAVRGISVGGIVIHFRIAKICVSSLFPPIRKSLWIRSKAQAFFLCVF
jgi:hypothetical protein